MSNISSLLNDLVRRISRREIRNNTSVVRRATAQYRRDIAALKRQVASLAKVVEFLEKQETRRIAEPKSPLANREDVRFRIDGLKSQRRRLGLSARDFGVLVGVTGQTVYDWELGKSRPRREQVARLAAIRGIGKREAQQRLQLQGARNGQPRQRGRFEQTAEQFIVSLIKQSKASTSSEINLAWAAAGRGGKADNTLSRMVKSGELTRSKLDGKRGSVYSA